VKVPNLNKLELDHMAKRSPKLRHIIGTMKEAQSRKHMVCREKPKNTKHMVD